MRILGRFGILFSLTLLVLAIFSFALAYLFPGDVLTNLTGIIPQNDAHRELLIQKHRLDEAYFFQFVHYLSEMLQGNWGYSFVSGLSLKEEIGLALPATIELAFYAMFIAIVIGLPVGCYAGLKSYTAADYSINSVSMVGYSFPVFWLALLFILLFSLELNIAPLSGRISLLFDVPDKTGFILIDILLADNIDTSLALRDAFHHLLLPTLALSVISTASMIRMTRRSVIDVLNRPYITAARSRGLSRWQTFSRHILRNALLPVLPLLAIQITSLITNAMIVETLFSWPGIGSWLIQAIYQRDYPALRVGMLAVATVVIMLTITIDLFNRLIDPSRDKYERATV
ncbi:ABC transporter permease [Salinimonas sp. HHU 13199]|uniref:ABC transporter permease n=1 Tax=Salinimonas profundi TaxID=2729140 RepID=A0ABR8LI98_9ALTE|nr:ABC transporter permease [Salinimonas profundi]MBD3585278.1 ABC transporter permease [Salinimonas profundi]